MIINIDNQSEEANIAATATLPKCTWVQVCDDSRRPPFETRGTTCSTIDPQTTTGARDRRLWLVRVETLYLQIRYPVTQMCVEIRRKLCLALAWASISWSFSRAWREKCRSPCFSHFWKYYPQTQKAHRHRHHHQAVSSPKKRQYDHEILLIATYCRNSRHVLTISGMSR